MKTQKNLKIRARYLGIVIPEDKYGQLKYKGYNHLFQDLEMGERGSYSYGRARVIPDNFSPGRVYTFKCSFKSSILSNIIQI